jgi:endo-1,4-beta-xylanase
VRVTRRGACILVVMLVVGTACSARHDARPASTTTTAVTATTVPVTSSAASATTLCLRAPESCSLRQVGHDRGALVGTSVVNAPLRGSAAYRALVAREFDSVTPENQAKWATIEAKRGVRDYAPMDAVVDFAVQAGLKVRGHTLLWDQAGSDGLPEWVAALNDRTVLRSAVERHIRAEVGRYVGRVDRWDVVNEPMQKQGASLDKNHLFKVLGPGYVADAFAATHAADPNATLWLNENAFEHMPAKGDGLVQLVADLVASGVPITGVGLQAHFLSGRAPAPGVIEHLVQRLRHLGVAVAITELDIPKRSGVSATEASALQADAYGQVVSECRRAGCSEITVWGADDSVTWLDDFLHRRTDPLLFDRSGRPKPAYEQFKRVLASTNAAPN